MMQALQAGGNLFGQAYQKELISNTETVRLLQLDE
jgi:hypothetical protein